VYPYFVNGQSQSTTWSPLKSAGMCGSGLGRAFGHEQEGTQGSVRPAASRRDLASEQAISMGLGSSKEGGGYGSRCVREVLPSGAAPGHGDAEEMPRSRPPGGQTANRSPGQERSRWCGGHGQVAASAREVLPLNSMIARHLQARGVRELLGEPFHELLRELFRELPDDLPRRLCGGRWRSRSTSATATALCAAAYRVSLGGAPGQSRVVGELSRELFHELPQEMFGELLQELFTTSQRARSRPASWHLSAREVLPHLAVRAGLCSHGLRAEVVPAPLYRNQGHETLRGSKRVSRGENGGQFRGELGATFRTGASR
jgi:hypothetical protein